MADYVLPDLPYDYGALEPHISGEIMELHHGKHHATYVKGLTPPSTSWPRPATRTRSAASVGLEKTLAFHLGGHINHSVFWPNLSPDGGDKPTGDLAQRHRRVLRQLRQVPRPLRGRTPTPSRAPAGRCWSGTPSGSG